MPMSAFAVVLFAAALHGSWPFIATSAVLQVIYFILVARTYQVAHMRQTYPLMLARGPLTVAILSAAPFQVSLSVTMCCGVSVICTGI